MADRRSAFELLAGALILLVAGGFLVYAVTNSGRASAAGGLNLTARFDRIDGLAAGADVRIAGVRVGRVVAQRIDPATFLAELTLSVDAGLRIPSDSSAEIQSESLLGGKYVSIVPGGAERILRDGQRIEITQSAISLESLLGRFIFSVTEMNRPATPTPGEAPAPAPPR
ncbi:outer membrane lipid asymmetry maintenance protein MlaD [Plastoroseomonas arctica]|uniref:Outer membrane lipid asymmetry maintenance protein MlaD n=1 Tax=Plastoroseomonas arctica TaxID=1509237 RepID=A0AAF1JXJ4_9PROT|nr:outer membrane lipid asymmetry maintenance protein MlaD [Plastoroseomonas arctica]MBR0654261.1 outer membrane lipid asymmetry maintenance protein MlaD [Plastoroseomonas arctica]